MEKYGGYERFKEIYILYISYFVRKGISLEISLEQIKMDEFI